MRLVIVLFAIISWPASAANFYAGTSLATVPWPGGIVPYEFTNTLNAAQTNTYLQGLREWELAGNVKFVPHTNQTHWILFTYNPNGFDNVSSTTNPQIVSVSSLSRAQVCHEMGHSFGFNHENIRPDATNFIAVVTNNITPGNLQFFQMDPTTVTNGPYDFESVMHLGWDFASTIPGTLPTQQPRPPYFPRYQFRMGNYTLSPGDRAALKFLYGPPTVPLTNIVTTTADAGPGSLRAAMYYVEDHPGSTVQFNISTSDPGYSNGVFTIHLSGQLPTLATAAMVIDGSTQPGFTGKPLIFVDASQIIPETFTSDTLLIYSANNQIKNISFSGFNWNGITLEYADATNNTLSGCWFGLDSTGTNAAPNAFQGILISAGANANIIGGTNALARNVISANGEYGIYLTDTTSNLISGNFIGVNAGGQTALGNALAGIGVFNGAHGNIIGGTSSGARNIISGNTNGPYYDYGVLVSGSSASGNVIEGNYIGLGADGLTPAPNYYGVIFAGGAMNNALGGTGAGAGNTISGNLSYDVSLSDPDTSGNFVEGNSIGTDRTGTNGVGDFIEVELQNGATGNFIGGVNPGAGNVIAFAGFLGVALYDAGTTNNSIRGNSIFGNYMGIHLVGNLFYPYVTTNDIGDGDAGPNNLQNFPVITNAFGYGTSTIISGTLNSATNRSFLIDVYRNFQPDDNIGGYGEGQFYLGTVSVTTDGSGNAGFAFTNAGANYSGQYISATATSMGGDTSEFCLDVLATNVPAPSAQFIGNFLWNTGKFTFALNLQTNFSYRIQTTTNLATSWIDLTNFTATNSLFNFTDRDATNKARFYRVVSP